MVTDFRGSSDAIEIEYNIQFPSYKCDKITFLQEVTKGNVHLPYRQDPMTLQPINDGKGCDISGRFITDKIGGDFRFNCETNEVSQEPINISHEIKYLYFHSTTSRSESAKALSHQSYLPQTFSDGAAIQQYVIQILPTQYITLTKNISYLNEYSVTQRSIVSEQYNMIESIGGVQVRGFTGVLVNYDFSPVRGSISTVNKGHNYDPYVCMCMYR